MGWLGHSRKEYPILYQRSGGYDQHFKEIGEKYGPFDITILDGGQYDRRWSWVHMTPVEAVHFIEMD